MVKNGLCSDRPRRYEGVVPRDVLVFKDGGSREGVAERKEHLGQGQQEVLVEVVQSTPGVVDVDCASMTEEETPDEAEFTYCKVTVLRGTRSFVAKKADANVGLLDHWDIVCTVTDGCDDE